MYRALRVQKVDGRRVLPGDLLPNAHEWKHRQLMIDAGYIEEVPDDTQTPSVPPVNVPDDAELDALKVQAKELGIKGFANMKKETLKARIEEAKQQQTTSENEG